VVLGILGQVAMRTRLRDRLDDARPLLLLAPAELFLEPLVTRNGHRHLVHSSKPLLWLPTGRSLRRTKTKTARTPGRRTVSIALGSNIAICRQVSSQNWVTLPDVRGGEIFSASAIIATKGQARMAIEADREWDLAMD